MAKFEAEIFYSIEHEAILKIYAESMGWKILAREEFLILHSDGSNEDDLLEDLNHAIGSFEQESVTPLYFQIVRVIFDSLGHDEITTTAEEICDEPV